MFPPRLRAISAASYHRLLLTIRQVYRARESDQTVTSWLPPVSLPHPSRFTMPTIVVTTRIAAPIDRCFDLARDVDAHVRTSAGTGERVVAGRLTGLLELGDSVTFEGVHLGVRQQLSARITELDRPRMFVDEMTRGAFASMRHVHDFRNDGGITVMTDTLTWRSPLGILGRIADVLVVRRHLRGFLETKQAALKAMAEAGARASEPGEPWGQSP